MKHFQSIIQIRKLLSIQYNNNYSNKTFKLEQKGFNKYLKLY